jgi:hypothetical protein
MKRIFAAALFAELVCAAAASAATVTNVYSGAFIADSGFPYLSIGDTYRIEFSYDTATPDADPDPQFGLYNGTLSANVVFSNGYNFSFSGGTIYVANDELVVSNSDYIGFSHQGPFSSNFPTGLYALSGVSWYLVDDATRTALSSDGLPTFPLSTAPFDGGSGNFLIGFNGIGRPGEGLSGTVTSTPVPSALPLFVSALGGFGILAWRRRLRT